MKNLILGIIMLVFTACTAENNIHHKEELVVNVDVTLWSDSFGDKKNPAILLIMGAGTQSIFWPEPFCKELSNQGFYVIRFDNRDTGKSSSIDYEKNPYSVMDLTKDALAVLDHYKIEKANIVGFSMGAEISQFIGAYFPERAKSLTIIGSSTNIEGTLNAIEGKENNTGLPSPKEEYLEAIKNYVSKSDKLEDKVADSVNWWKILNGHKIPLDEALYRKLSEESFTRTATEHNIFNHVPAMKASFADHAKAPSLIKLPTLIIQGSEDPILAPDHGEALHKAIINSDFLIVDGMGHSFNTPLFGQIIEAIVAHIRKTN